MRRLFSTLGGSRRTDALLRSAHRAFATSLPFFGRVVPYKLADIGEGIQEVQVLGVKVQPGDSLNEFDNICEVQSDKATVDITSRYTGVVKKVYIKVGETAKVGQPILDIELTEEEDAPAAPEPAAAPQSRTEPAAASSRPSVPFRLADIGEGIQEVQVLEVTVKKGDHVEEMEKLCVVQSDKATVEITSRYTGTVANVHVEAGKMFRVGHVLVDIIPDDAAEHAGAADPSATPSPPTGQAEASSPSSTPRGASAAAQRAEKVLATPATRYLAKLHKVDLRNVRPTGKGGRVTKEDIQAYLSGQAAAAPAAPPQAAAAAPAPAAPLGKYSGGVVALPGDEVVSIAGVRRGMVKTMTAAASVPMFSFTEEFEMSNLMTLRDSLKGSVERRTSGKVKLSFLPFFIKSASLALKEFPDLNAHCPPDCAVLVRKKAHNIGFAMDTPTGLIVPVVKDVANKNIFQIAEDVQKLIARGKANKLSTADFSDGTFSISNIGAIGGIATSPVVLPPQVGIAALGRTQVLPRFDATGEHITKAHIMTVGFSADHRVVDGATMVRFGVAWKRYIEHPGEMVLDMQ